MSCSRIFFQKNSLFKIGVSVFTSYQSQILSVSINCQQRAAEGAELEKRNPLSRSLKYVSD
jgi:hypothetical protein